MTKPIWYHHEADPGIGQPERWVRLDLVVSITVNPNPPATLGPLANLSPGVLLVFRDGTELQLVDRSRRPGSLALEMVKLAQGLP